MLSPLKIFLSAILALALSHSSWGQLKRFPAYQARPGSPGVAREDPSARTKQTTPLSLPFFDDFSKPFKGISPDTLLWENSSSVWVNDGMAIHPPTINVATFDGLNAGGMPYNPNEILLTGYTDTLTSQPIDLSEAAVAFPERSSVYLSFLYQWQGNLEPPDEKDHLELSFKTAEEQWETVMEIFPKDHADPTVFYDTIIPIVGDQFFHDTFQFRIRAFGRLSGPFDVWHVDYVYLNKGRDMNDLSFPDRALSTLPGPLFGKYRSIPRHHFFSNDQMTPPTFEIQNMKNGPASINFRTEGYFKSFNRQEGIGFPEHEVVISKATPINIIDNVLLAKEHKTIRMDTLPDISDPLQFPQDPGIDSTIIRLTVALQTRDNIPFNYTPPVEPDSTGDYTKNYIPIRFTANDTVTVDYVLSDYLAYDDGVAEYAAGLIEAGNLVAYEFDLDTAYALKQDTLIAFDVYFPPYAVTSNQSLDFYIYHEDKDNPGFPGEQWLRIAQRRVNRVGLNEFQRIQFLPAILINEKKFYIGWQHPPSGKAMVGLDMSNDTGDKIFVNTNGFWYQNEDVKGSLMLRPVFGSGIVDRVVGVEEPETPVGVYPNPNSGRFSIDGDITGIAVYSLTGQLIPHQSVVHDQRTDVTLQTTVPGLYVLRYRQNGTIRSVKVLVRQP